MLRPLQDYEKRLITKDQELNQSREAANKAQAAAAAAIAELAAVRAEAEARREELVSLAAERSRCDIRCQ